MQRESFTAPRAGADRSLGKEIDRRFQHMEDLNVALQELKEESESGTLAVGQGSQPKAPSLAPSLAWAGEDACPTGWPSQPELFC